ncbi:FAD-dependent oxidoreductase [Eggerthella sp. YY7918]|uniref:FAD-dependent oxidoreductase n=1 Tax=Eggerthella sp. (strain YY7918) TaxID=502558 RepID=UPI0002170F88|nr:FAD-dependent oxidoreductase [Eggerthella sp. YY7918]BAK43791.1 succinate dehydrogenase [Eggerthella sp. YY7918]
MEMNRRDFLKGMAASALVAGGTVGLAGCSPAGNDANQAAPQGASEGLSSGQHSWEVAPEPISDIAETKDYDIVIVGAGPSGCAAAEAASAQGARVAIIEQAASFTAHGADNGAINTQVHRDAGIEISPEEATRILFNFSQGSVNRDLVYTWASRSGAVFDHFSELCAARDIPSILAISETSKTDWNTLPDQFKEFRTGITFGRADEGVVIDTENFTFIESHLVETLLEAAVANGAETFFNTHAEQLVKEGDTVSGVVATAEDGKHIQFNAAKGVILATGDISGNDEMLACWAPIALRADVCQYFPPNGNLGEGILMGMWAGAAHSKSAAAPMVHPIAATLPLSALSMSWLAVNSLGERYSCEVPYEPYVTNARMNQPGNVAFTIFDGAYEEKTRAQEPETADSLLAGAAERLEAGIANGEMWSADTLEELADAIGVPRETFLATVKRYNEMCATENDVDFGVPARFLASVETPPFYAQPVPAVTLTVPFGLHVDKNSQVCTDDDQPIPGLFAVGNVQGDFFGFSYPVTCPGISHGRALTFGNLVGEALAQGKLIHE